METLILGDGRYMEGHCDRVFFYMFGNFIINIFFKAEDYLSETGFNLLKHNGLALAGLAQQLERRPED